MRARNFRTRGAGCSLFASGGRKPAGDRGRATEVRFVSNRSPHQMQFPGAARWMKPEVLR